MLYRRLPGTDLDLSVVGFGAWAIGGDYWGDDVDDARSTRAVHQALDEGINWFDTAPLYGHGHSEEVLIKALGPRRKDVIIATKVGVHSEGDHARSVLTPEHLRKDLDATLRRLRTETIDLLQVHWPCEDGTPLEVTFTALDALRREGKVRYLGVCNYNAEALRQIRAVAPIVSLQTPYSMLRRELEHSPGPTCEELGLGILAYEPLCRGLLSGRFKGPHTFPETDLRSRDDRFRGGRFQHGLRLTASLAQVAQKIGVPTAAVAIGWVCSRPGITAAIAGAKGPEQVRENAIAGRLAEKKKLWEVVDKVAAVHGGTPR